MQAHDIALKRNRHHTVLFLNPGCVALKRKTGALRDVVLLDILRVGQNIIDSHAGLGLRQHGSHKLNALCRIGRVNFIHQK